MGKKLGGNDPHAMWTHDQRSTSTRSLEHWTSLSWCVRWILVEKVVLIAMYIRMAKDSLPLNSVGCTEYETTSKIPDVTIVQIMHLASIICDSQSLWKLQRISLWYWPLLFFKVPVLDHLKAYKKPYNMRQKTKAKKSKKTVNAVEHMSWSNNMELKQVRLTTRLAIYRSWRLTADDAQLSSPTWRWDWIICQNCVSFILVCVFNSQTSICCHARL